MLADSWLNMTEILLLYVTRVWTLKCSEISSRNIFVYFMWFAKYTTIIFLNRISDLQRCDNLHSCRRSITFQSSLSSVSAWTNPSTYEVETAFSSKSKYSAAPAWCYNLEGEDVNNPRRVKTGNFILIFCCSGEAVYFLWRQYWYLNIV